MIRDMKGPNNPRYMPFTEEEKYKLKYLYYSGYTVKEVASIAKVSYSTMVSRFKEWGVEMRVGKSKVVLTEAIKSKAVALRLRGLEWKVIAKKYGVSPSHLQNVVRPLLKGLTSE